MNYVDTFIRVAPDCPVTAGTEPPLRGEKKTAVRVEYELLRDEPYRYTQEELLFELYHRVKETPPVRLKKERESLWKEFYSRPHACQRGSALAKKYGWGFHFDREGKVAMVAMESDAYRRFAASDGGLTLRDALRSRRG